MLIKLLEKASKDQLVSFLMKEMSEVKKTDYEMYEELYFSIYTEVNGCHFDKDLLEHAVKDFVNEDGSVGAHWSIEDTTSVAKQNGIQFSNFNEYDWNYVMNMIYSDYYGVFSNDLANYVKMAKKFLDDKDAPKGKALKYYIAMK